MLDAIGWIILLGLVLGPVAYFALRSYHNKEDKARRQAKSEAYDQREQDRLRAALFRDIHGFFPSLAGRFNDLVSSGVSNNEAVFQAIEETPGVVVGTVFGSLPALLAEPDRRRHLYTIGKTGSGKTTLLLNLIKVDLDAGRGVGVIAPEAELFRDWLLPLIPEDRAEDVIYFAPGNPKNPVSFNPLVVEEGHDRGRASDELMTVFKRALGGEEFGARMTPILGNAFACLMGRPGATLWHVKRLLEDAAFRKTVLDSVADDYLRDFWTATFPQYPKGSHLPIVSRLDQFLRPLQVRQALCRPTSSFSIRQALDEKRILLLDLSGLAPDSMLLIGQMLLSKFQLELMRREDLRQEERVPFYLYADEFQTFAGVAEGTWRELFSRGRRYGLAVTLAHQYPSQLPEGLQNEILGNVGPIIAFALSAKDAQAVRRELLDLPLLPVEAKPVPVEPLVTLRTGQAIGRLGSGAYAVKLQTADPLEPPPAWRGERVREISWERYGVGPLGENSAAVSDRGGKRSSDSSDDFLE